MKKYIHIGYPKNFSTSLQRDYFSKHPEIYHLGIGLESNLGYRDTMVEKTFEVYLKTSKRYQYQDKEVDIIDHFQNIFQNKDLQYKAVGASSEHLSFAFSYDGLAAEEKAQRLYTIFGAETKIIMIVRNQFEMIKSLYRECVRVGFGHDFAEFVKLVYKYQDRNFVYDFRYDFVYSSYISLFGSANVKVFFFENYRATDGSMIQEDGQVKLFKDLNDFLEISDAKMELRHYNEALPKNKILVKAQMNRLEPHDLGNHLLESAEKHRIKTYLEEDLAFVETEVETYSDVLIKRNLIKKTNEIDQEEPLLYLAEELFVNGLKDFYEAGNLKFAKLLRAEIPVSYTNLKL